MFNRVGDARHNQFAALDTHNGGCARNVLVVRQGLENLLADDVLHADEARLVAVAVKNHTLMEIFVQHDAKVMGFDLPSHVVGIEVKAIEVHINLLDRRDALESIRSGI